MLESFAVGKLAAQPRCNVPNRTFPLQTRLWHSTMAYVHTSGTSPHIHAPVFSLTVLIGLCSAPELSTLTCHECYDLAARTKIAVGTLNPQVCSGCRAEAEPECFENPNEDYDEAAEIQTLFECPIE